MNRKILSILLIMVFVFAIFSGCTARKSTEENQTSKETSEPSASSSETKKSEDEGSKVVLEMYTHSYQPMVDVLKQMIEKYKSVAPNVQINYTPIPDEEFFTKVPVLLSTKQPVDILNIHNSHMAKYLSLFAEAPDYVVEDIQTNSPAAYEISLINGKIYGYPFPDLHVMFVNKDMYEEAGINYPKTWDELVEVDKKLTKEVIVDGKPVQKYGVNLWAGAGNFLFTTAYFNNVLEAMGGSMFTEDGKLNLNTEEAVRALEIFKALCHPEGDAFYLSFAQGNTATVINCRWYIPWLRQNGIEGLKWEVLPPPAGVNGKPIGQGYFQMQVVLNYRPKENQDEAWKFLAWMHNDENNYQLEKVAGFGNWRLSTIERMEKEDPLVGLALKQGRYATKPIINENWQIVERIVGEWVEKFVLNKVPDAKTALSNAQSEIEKNIGK